MPALSTHVAQKFPISFQNTLMQIAVRKPREGVVREMGEDRTEEECQRLVDETFMRPAVGNHRHLRFLGFDQARVDELGACFDIAHAMLTEARPHVGLHTWPGKTKYEAAFGARAWHGSSATRKAGLVRGDVNAESGFLSRARFVRDKIDQMLADLRDPRWIVYRSTEAGDAAAAKGGLGGYTMAIGPGFPRGRAGHFHAGVLIHEMGHNRGLADICDQCPEPKLLLESAHFVPYTDDNIPPCRANSKHGAMVVLGKGHFIGSKQVKRLAENHKNATIYNTDSYRWYCYAFFRNLVDAGIAEHKRLLQPA